jgi:thermitase
MKSRMLLAALAVAGLSVLTTQGTAQSPVGPPEFVPSQVLVQFRADATPELRASARARVRGVREEVVVAATRRNDGKGDLELVRIPPGLAVSDAARGLAEDSAVEFAEPNWIYQHQATSNDPYYFNGSLWGMYGDATSPANQFGSQAGEAWARGNVGSRSVYVGIIDEGVMRNHTDLNMNMWVNLLDNTVNGVDEDGNGFVDDVHGWDFDGKNNTVYDGTQDDHGTHVAGTIGAVGGNASGVAGVNWEVVMIPVKFLGRRGGTTANAIKAVDYLTDLKVRHGIRLVATNNSWGGGGFSQGLLDAINRGGDQGILFVAAAGNGGNDGVGDNNDTTANYPSNYQCTSNNKPWDCVIAVAALTSTGARSGFSNYGLSTVDLGAPGSGIYSTVPGKQNSSSYASYSGTSMATPHVTGAAALYGARYFGATAAMIKEGILTSAIATQSMSGRTTTGGRLNVSGF